MPDHAAGVQMRRTTATSAAAGGAAASGSRPPGPSVAGRARARSTAAAGSPTNAAGSSPTSSVQRSSSGEWESADELEAAALEQQGVTGSRPADAVAASIAPVSAAAAAGSGAGVQPSAASSVVPPAAAGPPSTTGPTQAGMQAGSGQLHQQAGQAPAATQETTAGSIGSGGVNSGYVDRCPGSAAAAGDWRESWQASLLQLSQSAAAAAAAGPAGVAVGSSALVTHAGAADATGATQLVADSSGMSMSAMTTGAAAAACNTDGADIDMHDAAAVQQAVPGQQQQPQGHEGQLVLSPYAAQLLQQACEVTMQHPEHLMLQGTLSPADSPPSSADSIAADPANGAAAAAGSPQSAAATARAGVQQTEAGSSAEAHLRAGALPPSRAPQQQDMPRAERAAQTSTAPADAATAAGGAAPGGYRMSFIQAPGTGGTRRHQPQQQQQPKDDSEPGDACTHGVVLLAGLVEVLLQRLLRAAAEVAASDPELLLHSSPADPASSQADAVGTAAAGAGAAGAAGAGAASRVPYGLPDGAVLMSSPGQQPQVLVGAKHVQLAVVQDEDLATLLQHR